MPLMSIITIEHQLKQHQMLSCVWKGMLLMEEYMIRKLKWKEGDMYYKIAKVYADFTIKHNGLVTVVFNEYMTQVFL